MELRKKKSRISKYVKYIYIKEYNYKDIIDIEQKFSGGKEPFIHRFFLPRLKHIPFKADTHPKRMIAEGMAASIFFEYIKLIIDELFKGNTIRFYRLGEIELRTSKWSTRYQGYGTDYNRSKRLGYFTGIFCRWDVPHRFFRYGYPSLSLGKSYKKRLHKLEDKGIKF